VGVDFEWDPAKELSNIHKHGISFLDAIDIFDDPFHLIEESTRPEYGERRVKAIGQVDSVILAVIFTDRDERRRIISARRAKRRERRQYDYGPATS
jgi:uncharacterized DUF497 family protein